MYQWESIQALSFRVGKSISRCNLAEANERSDSRIFELFAYEMIAEARKCCIADSDFSLSIKGNVYAFDSTVIDMCLNVFWWGTFRRAKAAVNLHTLFDVKTSIPVFVHVIPAIVHDVNGLDHLAYGAGGYYIMDRGHVDFARFHVIDQHHAFFVTRAKNNSQLTRISSAKPDKAKGNNVRPARNTQRTLFLSVLSESVAADKIL